MNQETTDKTDEKQITEKPWLFKKGESGNPAGRPKGSFSLTEMLRDELQKVPDGQKLSYAEALIKKILHKAINEGEQQTQKLIFSYIDGLPRQPIDLGVDKEGLAELTQFFREMASKKDE